NPEAQTELMRKLAYENANADCRRAMQAVVGRPEYTLAQLLQACADVGTQTHQMALLPGQPPGKLVVGPATSPRPKAAPLSVHDVPAATRGSAGIDLVNQENMDITLPGEVLLMPSQIQGPLPEGTVGLVLPRSSASKQGLFVVPGVSHLPKQLFQRDAWAQLILVPYSLPLFFL
uniref:dUTPase-like domain-containing protein n=1 Tax=Chrysemys picta bellii TaxID=8478 RepID=A0A8C3IDX4_CHRPI